MTRWAWTLVLVALLPAACVSRPAARGPRPTATDRVPLSHRGPPPRLLEEHVEESDRLSERRRVLLEPQVAPDHEAIAHVRDPIEVRLTLPHAPGGGRRPVILMSPILGSKSLLLAPFEAAFARRGWITAVVLRKELTFDPDSALEQAEPELALLVERSRQALDWLLTRDDVDPDRLATCGVSAGAIVSAMVGGSDTRFRAHVWLLAGGPLADVMCDTVEGRFERWGRELRQRHGLTQDEVRARLKAIIRTDPVALASNVARESVLLLLARHDRSVPTSSGWALYEALGRPALRILPFGHYTSFLLLPWVLQETTAFLAQRFGLT